MSTQIKAYSLTPKTQLLKKKNNNKIWKCRSEGLATVHQPHHMFDINFSIINVLFIVLILPLYVMTFLT